MTDQAAFARALLDPQLACPSGLKTWNGSDPALRFAVYRNNVVVSLVDALAQSFPITQALVGEEFFRAMARVYLQAAPPRCRVLAWVGEGLPGFIESFPPAATLPYLADLARLEMLWIRACHAADMPALEPQSLGLALGDPDRLPGLRLVLHPSVHLLLSDHAVCSLWAAHQEDEVCLSTVDPCVAESAMVFREGQDVRVLRLTAAQGLFVHGLQRGAPLAASAEQAAQRDSAFELSTALAMLIRHRLVCDFCFEEDDHEAEQ